MGDQRKIVFVAAVAALIACYRDGSITAPRSPAARVTRLTLLHSIALTTADARFPLDLVGVGTPTISQAYAEYNDVSPNGYHTGADFTPNVAGAHPVVHAALSGVIVLVQQNGPANCTKKPPCKDHGFGNTVIIQHVGLSSAPAPANTTFFTQYSHLAAFDDLIVALCPSFPKNKKDWTKNQQLGLTCRPNAQVSTGATLGLMGNSEFGGFGPIGAHLHFETKTFNALNTTAIGTAQGCQSTGFGYTCQHPDAAGYFDATLIFHPISVVTPTATFSLAAGASLFTGPGPMPLPIESRQYRQIGNLPSGVSVTVVRQSVATSNCATGWAQLRRTDGANIPDTGDPGASAAAMRDVWACLVVPEPANTGVQVLGAASGNLICISAATLSAAGFSPLPTVTVYSSVTRYAPDPNGVYAMDASGPGPGSCEGGWTFDLSNPGAGILPGDHVYLTNDDRNGHRVFAEFTWGPGATAVPPPN